MGELQSLDKAEGIKTCSDLASHFIERHWEKYGDYDEVHLVFDRNDIGESLKTPTHEKRLDSTKSKAVPSHNTDTTSIAKTSMQSLLAHVKTKDELSAYLANKSFNMLRQMASVLWLLGTTKQKPRREKLKVSQAPKKRQTPS